MYRARSALETGETLVELLVTIVIIGVAVVGIIGGLATAVFSSDAHRKDADSESIVQSYSEFLVSNATSYLACTSSSVPTKAQYAAEVPTSLYQPPTGYTVAPTSVAFWTGTNPADASSAASFSSGCPSNGDLGLQLIQVTASSTDGKDTETLSILKRSP
jgi:Tfp pilus assembly protein PilV